MSVDRNVAMSYASGGGGGGKAGIVLEARQAMVDRGADLAWLSQYPHEAEVCFAPLTGVEMLSSRVEEDVLVVEVRLSVNLTALTIEQASRECCEERETRRPWMREVWRWRGRGGSWINGVLPEPSCSISNSSL